MDDVRQYTIVVYHEDEGGYSVTVPAIPGCNTQGDDLAEAFDMAKDAIALMLDCMVEHGEAIPDDLPEVTVDLKYASEAMVCRLRVPSLAALPPVSRPQRQDDAEE